MTYADIALLGCFVIVAWVAADWRRGKTGLGRLKLTKEETPERFWMAIALYLNMAFALLWLNGKVAEPTAVTICPNGETSCELTIEPVTA